ncbi:trehalose-phosphatase [Aliihoeflea sp. 40Bstr573]|uniref:trehalose-phosphatase n=1 Tax=Aliihoeflea sp. 40Bstr573 TaxID=2696467 RepID=UPI002095B982
MNIISTKSLADLRIPCPTERLAVFLDFDGTLADIVEHPDDVHLPVQTGAALESLARLTSGAVAIVTGRPIEQIDALVAPLVLPVAGVHGMWRRGFDGTVHSTQHNADLFAEAQARLTQLHLALADTMIEIKPGSIAFHYRRRPDLGDTIATRIHDVLGELDGLDILHGKMVVEVKAGHAHKGDAIRAFMAEEPFAGRIPLFAGDDVTDEFGFAAVNEMDGVAIKIGPGHTAASWRVDDPGRLREWLVRLADVPA